jgi:hypothetical protein
MWIEHFLHGERDFPHVGSLQCRFQRVAIGGAQRRADVVERFDKPVGGGRQRLHLDVSHFQKVIGRPGR